MPHSFPEYVRLLLQPWKVVTALLGTVFFVFGAWWFSVPTWDAGVGLWMSVLCYALAPLGVSMAIEAWRDHDGLARVGRLIGSAAIIYFVGSGSYEIYHIAFFNGHPPTYWPNLFFSVPVTIIAGILWRFDGSLAEMWSVVRAAADPDAE